MTQGKRDSKGFVSFSTYRSATTRTRALLKAQLPNSRLPVSSPPLLEKRRKNAWRLA